MSKGGKNTDLRQYSLLINKNNKHFEKTYNDWDKEKKGNFYLFLLSKIKDALLMTNAEYLKKYCKVLSSMNNVTDRETLQIYFNYPENPLKNTNVVILSCKNNNAIILQFLLGNSRILEQLSIGIGRETIQPNEEDNENHNVFYYAIREGNVLLLNALKEKWSSTSKDYFNCLAKSYEELRLKNIYISTMCEVWVEKQLINNKFLSKTKEITNDISNIPQRIYMVVDAINSMYSEYFRVVIDEKFLFSVNFIARNIYILKNKLKTTYDSVPWEEMEFILIAFLKAQVTKEGIYLLIKPLLNKNYLLELLKKFTNNLIHCVSIIQKGISNNCHPKVPRTEIVQKIIQSKPHYVNLYEVYSQIQDIYSLNIISTHIKLALKSHSPVEEADLIIIRTLQIVGEHLKSTVQCPKLSASTCEYLMLSIPKHIREVIFKIRDTLSHGCLQTLRNRDVPGSTELYSNVKDNLEKINIIIERLLSKHYKEIIRLILRKLLDCENADDIREISQTFDDVNQIYREVETMFPNSEDTNVKVLIKELKQKINKVSLYEKDLFSKIEKIFENNDDVLCSEKLDFLHALLSLSSSHISLLGNEVDESTVRTIKWSVRQALNKLSHGKKDKENIEIMTHLKQIKDSLFSRLLDEEMLLNISKILFQIYSTVQLESVSYQWIEEFLDVLCDNHISTAPVDGENGRNTDKTDFSIQRVKELNNFVKEKLLVGTEEENVEKYKKNKSLQAILEILLLDLLSILGDKNKILVGNNVFLDNYSPLLTGRNLRNHLAHGNALMDVISSDPSTAILINAQCFCSNDIANIKRKKIGHIDQEDIISARAIYEEKMLLLDVQQKMFDALMKGDLCSVKKYVKNGADINGKSFNSWTSLHFAAKGPSLECVKYVIGVGVSVHSKDHIQRSPLHISAVYGRASTLQYLIEEQNMPVNDFDVNNITCLHLAAQYGHKSVVEVLLKYEASTDVKNKEGMSPVHFAVRNNHEDVVKVLLERERHVDANEVLGGFTLLHLAAEKGHASLVRFLLNNNANVNAISDKQHCPIHTAALNGHLDVVKILISENALVDVEVPGGGTPLHFAVENGHESVAKVLLDNGANPNGSKRVLDFPPPLCYAAGDDNQKIVEMLIKYGADRNLSSKEHLMPLHYAVMNNHADIVHILAENNAAINSKVNGIAALQMSIKNGNVDIFNYLRDAIAYSTLMKYSNDLFFLAVENGNVKIVELLLSFIPDVNVTEDGNSPLHIACTRGHTLVANKLIQEGANIDRTNMNGWSPLHCAVKSGVLDLVQLLIDKNAKLLVFDSMHCTPLHTAAFLNKLDIVKILLKKIGDPNIKNAKGQSPLYLAVLNNHFDVTKLLIEHGATVSDGSNSDILNCAVENNNKDIVRLLLSNGADVNSHFGEALTCAVLSGNKNVLKVLLNDKNFNIAMNRNIILEAVKRNNNSIVQLLLEKGADPNIGEKESGTPLHYAAANGMKEIARLLLENNANVNSQFIDGITPLHLAAKFGCKAVVSLLLDYNADRTLKDLKHRTSLHFAVISGNVEVIDLLLEENNINDVLENYNNITLLHIAAQYGYVDVTDHLIKRGANPLIKNEFGSKPIHFAARDGHVPLVEYYLNEMISIHDVGVDGQSLLHYAALSNQLECAKFLINKNIDINTLDNKGNSPLHVAASQNHLSMVKFLLQNGAYFNIRNVNSQKPLDLTNSTDVFTLLSTTEKLYEAVKSNNITEVQKNIDLGAIVNTKHSGDISPLHFASWKGFSEIVKVLLKKGANPNILGKGGCTPLHYASKYSHVEVVKKLLIGGAIYNAESEKQKTPLEFTENHDVTHVLKLLHRCFDGVEKGYKNVVIALNKISDIDIVKCVMNAKNKENLSIIVFADRCNYPHLTKLKEVGQGNISECLTLSSLLAFKGDYENALSVLKEQLDKRREVLGTNNPATLEIEDEIVKIYYKQSKYQDSLKMQEEIFLKQKEILGENHKSTLESESTIGLILHRLGRNEEAMKIFEKVYPQQLALLGSHHSEVLKTQLHMGLVLHALHKLDEALKCNYENLEKHITVYGPMSLETLSVKNNVALVLSSLNKYEDAYNMFMEVYNNRKIVLGPNAPDTLRSLSNAADVLCRKEKSSESVNFFHKVLDSQIKILGPNHVDTLNTKAAIARTYLFQGKYANAYKMISEYGDARNSMFGNDHMGIKVESALKQSIEEIFSRTGAEHFLHQPIKNDIFSAAASGEKNDVEDLVKSGVNVNVQDSNGRTALHFAVSNGHKDIVTFLCKSGSDVTIMSGKGNSALHIGASKNYVEIVKIILHFAEKNSSTKLQDFVNYKTTLNGNTALHVTEDTQIVKLLLSNGAIYNLRNKNEKMPIDVTGNKCSKKMFCIIDKLFGYIKFGNRTAIDMMQQLPEDELSAATKSRNADGRTLIQEAIFNGQKELASEILKLLR